MSDEYEVSVTATKTVYVRADSDEEAIKKADKKALDSKTGWVHVESNVDAVKQDGEWQLRESEDTEE